MRFRLRPSLGGISLILLVIAATVRVPYVLITPGPVFSTIGEVDGQQFITISGVKTYPTEGDLFMTTVSEYGGPSEGIDIFQAIWGLFDPTHEVAPRENFYDESVTEEENRLQNVEAFNSSQTYAVGAALKYLKLPVIENVVISSITEGAPALGLLKAGDKIISVNEKIPENPKAVAMVVRNEPVGTLIKFTVLRAGKQLEVLVITAAKVDDPTTEENEAGLPYVGIGLDMQYSGNFDVAFAQTNIGGPSAGMMFSVGIIDLLTPGALTQGKKIAGTGTIDGDGNIGPIGGISRKLIGAAEAGASLFLAPKLNCDEVVGHIPDGLTVTPVETLSDSIKAIEEFNSGKPLAKCEALN